jgi:hypothetical protein
MEKIYLNKEEFDSFINKKYWLTEGTGAKKPVKKEFALELKSGYRIGTPVFLSNISKIKVPDISLLPQLKTLYGIPAGLLEVEVSKLKKSPKDKVNKSEEFSIDELKFLALRRGILYAHVWAIKGFDMESVRIGMRYLLTKDKLQLINAWLNELVVAGKYPEIKPPKLSLDSSQYEFQFIGMGVFLRNYFFSGTEIMPAEDRDWLRYKLNNADLSGVPGSFNGFEGILAGYLIALKASNINKCNLDYILEKAAKFNTGDRSLYYGIIVSALFFIGVFESKANFYFFAAASTHLFEAIEKFCYEVVHEDVYVPDFDLCYDEISDAILNSIPNIIEYYRLKNPAIDSYEAVIFSEEHPINNDKNKIILIKPEQSLQLLEHFGQLYKLMDQFKHNLTVTADPDLFNLLQRNGFSVVLRNQSGLIEGKIRLSGEGKVFSDSQLLKRWIKRFFPKTVFIDESNSQKISPHWIFIGDEYKISESDQYFIRKLNYKPESITVFNFSNPLITVKPEVSKSQSKKKVSAELFTKNEIDANLQGSNPLLQSLIEKLFPGVPVRVITKMNQELPWEMVLLGIGTMQDVSFHDCTFFDIRNNKADKDVFEFVLRCFRDLIVLDKEQRYMFMNLN